MFKYLFGICIVLAITTGCANKKVQCEAYSYIEENEQREFTI